MNNPGVYANVRSAYDSWHSRLAAQDTELHSWHRNVLRLLSAPTGSRILEIGCGRGDFAATIAAVFPDSEVTAVDFSGEAIAIARARHATASGNLRFDVGDATALTFDDSAFDIVISCECIEHIPEPQLMASEIARVLRGGGAFYLTTENYLNGMALMWLKSLVTGVPIDTGSGTQPHENFFLFWRVKRMLEREGLNVTYMESDNFQWLMLPGVSPEKLATSDFSSPFLKRLFRPFGRHFLYSGTASTR